jgi:7,8-dihydropterin-6-yl-methyl-4-(beta-D-ribofuranosyl)aminobenzene 5'-phosphate synthase
LILSKNFWISELVLAIKTSKGIIIITGCSHTGIHQIVKRVYSDLQDEIYALFGGFHLFRSSTNKIHKISDILKEMEVKVIAPCHCTGDKALKILKKEFSKSCLENGVGIEYLFEV